MRRKKGDGALEERGKDVGWECERLSEVGIKALNV